MNNSGKRMKLRAENIVKNIVNERLLRRFVRGKPGEIVGLLGPNGAGKTTSFYMIVGLIQPLSGYVFLDDEDITRLPVYKRAQRGLAIWPRKLRFFGN
jgi:lipopolysaccharide export system ATP-binding protein